jgi:hypothetical protein
MSLSLKNIRKLGGEVVAYSKHKRFYTSK